MSDGWKTCKCGISFFFDSSLYSDCPSCRAAGAKKLVVLEPDPMTAREILWGRQVLERAKADAPAVLASQRRTAAMHYQGW